MACARIPRPTPPASLSHSHLRHPPRQVGQNASARDSALQERLRARSHLPPEALGVRPPFSAESASAWDQPVALLCRLHAYRAPCDKCALIVNACRLIQRRLGALCRKAGGARGEFVPPGADDFFPVLVWVVLLANPPRATSEVRPGRELLSAPSRRSRTPTAARAPQVSYIARFRSHAALRAVHGCYFTHFRAAVTFLEQFDGAASARETRASQRLVLRQTTELSEAAWHPLAPTTNAADPRLSEPPESNTRAAERGPS